MKNQKGFSLVELLVVVIIIAIIAAIAIPSLLASRRAANEASAIQTLRTYHSAQVTYLATTGNGTAYGATTALAGLVDPTLAGASPVSKSGYTFTETAGALTTAYCIAASPTTGNGTRHFAIGIGGVVYQSNAAITCPNTGIIAPSATVTAVQ